MKVYGIVIKPVSPFATPLRSNTIFGHISWQIEYFFEKLKIPPLKNLLSDYETDPFLITSSAHIYLGKEGGDELFAIKKPDVPLEFFPEFRGLEKYEKILKRKDIKRKKWIIIKNVSDPFSDERSLKLYSDEEIFEKIVKEADKTANTSEEDLKREIPVWHNSINRILGRTGMGFSPYAVDVVFYHPAVRFVVFVGIKKKGKLTVEVVRQIFENIGRAGFGKDSSTGCGRFEVLGHFKVKFLNYETIKDKKAVFTLGTCVPEKELFEYYYFKPYVHFGKLGDRFVKTGNPFKNPVVMAEEGAVFGLKEDARLEKLYIGRGLKGVSKINFTVEQGYSLYVPLKNLGSEV